MNLIFAFVKVVERGRQKQQQQGGFLKKNPAFQNLIIEVEPEVDVLLLPHMSDHGGLPAVPVHGQINKVDLGNGQIDLKSNQLIANDCS